MKVITLQSLRIYLQNRVVYETVEAWRLSLKLNIPRNMVVWLGTKLGQSRTINSLWKMLDGVVRIHVTYQNGNGRPEDRGRGNKEKNQQNSIIILTCLQTCIWEWTPKNSSTFFHCAPCCPVWAHNLEVTLSFLLSTCRDKSSKKYWNTVPW